MSDIRERCSSKLARYWVSESSKHQSAVCQTTAPNGAIVKIDGIFAGKSPLWNVELVPDNTESIWHTPKSSVVLFW